MLHVYEAHIQHYTTENVCTIYNEKEQVAHTCKGSTGDLDEHSIVQNNSSCHLAIKTLQEVFSEALGLLEREDGVTIISCDLKKEYSSDDRPADYVYTIIARS